MFLAEPEHTEAVETAYRSDLTSDGYINNNTRIWSHRTDVLDAFVDLRSRLTDASSLSDREIAVLVVATASTTSDSYCALAWGRRLTQLADDAAAVAVITGSDAPSLTERELALAAWARAVVAAPNETTGDDVDRLRATGLDDRTIFEATALIAFRLAFSVVDDALGASPDQQLADAVPPRVRRAVTFGRAPAVATSRER